MAEDRTNEAIWLDILKLQLDGVMMHNVLFEYFELNGLTGYRNLHHRHAEEEYCTYLSLVKHYIELYQKVPEMLQISAPVVELNGATVKEKMEKGMNAYQDWEISVCRKLEGYKEELNETDDCLNKLIDNVHCELKYINLMQNDLLDGKYEELNCYLTRKWGD